MRCARTIVTLKGNPARGFPASQFWGSTRAVVDVKWTLGECDTWYRIDIAPCRPTMTVQPKGRAVVMIALAAW